MLCWCGSLNKAKSIPEVFGAISPEPDRNHLCAQLVRQLADATQPTMAGLRALGKVVSACENTPLLAPHVVDQLAGVGGGCPVIGVTGPPGVGKSTLSARLVQDWVAAAQRTAVLAVDPSSAGGGALLGDRIRFSHHGADARVFFRSLATRGALGGLSLGTFSVLDVVRRLGFYRVLLETVGTGQNEVDVAALADVTVVVVAPGQGDGIQAMKAGVLDIADVLVVNQADRAGADRMVAQLRTVLARQDRSHVPVVTTSAIDDAAPIVDVHEAINGVLGSTLGASTPRSSQRLVREAVNALLWQQHICPDQIQRVIGRVDQGDMSVMAAAQELVSGILTGTTDSATHPTTKK